MKNLIDPESPLMQLITKIVTSVWLNILWFVCCLPILTIGPATTALFYCCDKMVRNEDGNITKSFFHSFRENFRQGMLIGCIVTILGVLLGADGYVLYHLHTTSAFWTLITAIYLVAVAAYAIVLMYVFPLLAHFDNTTVAMFKNSIFIGMRFLLCTGLMALIYFSMLVIIVRIFTPAVIFGMGTCALLCSMLLKNILIQCQNPDEETQKC